MPRKSFLKNYLNFSRSERYGILGLCGCILLVFAARLSLPRLIRHKYQDPAACGNEIALFRQAVDSVQTAKVQALPPGYDQPAAEFFFFDPNSITGEEWEKLGMTGRQIRNIRNYQAKGGRFRRKEDLGKLYTIPAPQYKQLAPYIRIADAEPAKRPDPVISVAAATKPEAVPGGEANTAFIIELNTADSSLLTQLPGIGPALASRIVKYRNRIGGYAAAAQLGEVYGIRPELVGKLSPQLSADQTLIRKIPVNTATFKELVSHPYFSEQQTKGILHYRKLQNRINHPDDLIRNHILTQEEADRIKPYISFD